MKNHDRHLKLIALALIATFIICTLAACGGSKSSSEEINKASFDDPFAGRDPSIVLGYEGMEGYEGEIMFCDTTVKEVKELMDDKRTFVLFCSFETCPWCNLLISHLNDAAREAGVHVGYIDTRSNPEWQSNMDIDDYDVFTDLFGEWLSEDADGKPHLYVPGTYFIKNGKVVARHDGVTPGVEDPSNDLTSEQVEQLKKDLADEFKSLN